MCSSTHLGLPPNFFTWFSHPSDHQQNRLGKDLSRNFGMFSKTFVTPEWIQSVVLPHSSGYCQGERGNNAWLALYRLPHVRNSDSSVQGVQFLDAQCSNGLPMTSTSFNSQAIYILLLGSCSQRSQFGTTMSKTDVIEILQSISTIAPPPFCFLPCGKGYLHQRG